MQDKITATGATGTLAGSVMRSGRVGAPVLLLVPGSGPTDRDGNNPLGVRAQPYRLLAEALAANGVDTVRIDKRGMFGSRDAGDPNAVTLADYVADVKAWLNAIRAKLGDMPVWLAGHSEGGVVAMASAGLGGVRALS